MPDVPVFLVKIPLLATQVVRIAQSRGWASRLPDEGYLVHCLLRELWQDVAPGPFVVSGRSRWLEVWGYGRLDAAQLQEHAGAFADPALVAAIDDHVGISGKRLPVLPAGRRIGFVVRACPVVRLRKAINGHRGGAEVDAFLARCFGAAPGIRPSRASVYEEWLASRLQPASRSGVVLERVAVRGFRRERLVRRTQGPMRASHRLERPDVTFEGDLVVSDGTQFMSFLAHGVGRHRAFGYGALMLVPPSGAGSAR